MSVTAIIIISALSLLSIASIYFAIKFAMILLNVEDALEESLDVLDDRYASISRVLEIPVFYDSPEVKMVVSDIEECRDAILRVASSLSSNVSSKDNEETYLEEKEKD